MKIVALNLRSYHSMIVLIVILKLLPSSSPGSQCLQFRQFLFTYVQCKWEKQLLVQSQ